MNNNGYQPNGPRLDDANPPQDGTTAPEEFKYDVTCRINWGNSVPEVQKILDDINGITKQFGGADIPKLTYEGEFHMTVTANKKLPERALYIIKTSIAHSFLETLTEYDIRVESIKEIF